MVSVRDAQSLLSVMRDLYHLNIDALSKAQQVESMMRNQASTRSSMVI
jgi:hypothetical protein